MDIFQSLILGVVEGATEFLPISSTGHLILASSLLGVMQSDFVKTFEIAVQLGAILAVVVLYWRAIFDIELVKKLVVAFLPTALIGLAFYQVVERYFIGNELVVLFTLMAGGVALIVFERWRREPPVPLVLPHANVITVEAPAPAPSSLTYRQALLVGLAQAVAIIPGVSRSGATVVGGLALGIPRPTIVEFSFLLAVPTMVAATALSLYSLDSAILPQQWGTLGIGFFAAFAVALCSIRWLLTYVRRHSFTAFGIYRIILSLAFFTYLFA